MSRVYKLVPIPGTTDSLVILTGTAGGQTGDFEPAVISDPDNPDVVAAVKTADPSDSEAGIVMRIAGGVDSAEKEYTPGLKGQLVTASGDTLIYTPGSGKSLRLHWFKATNDPFAGNSTLITIRLGDGGTARTVCVDYIIGKRKRVTGPVDGKLYVNLSQAANVAANFDIEEF